MNSLVIGYTGISIFSSEDNPYMDAVNADSFPKPFRCVYVFDKPELDITQVNQFMTEVLMLEQSWVVFVPQKFTDTLVQHIESLGSKIQTKLSIKSQPSVSYAATWLEHLKKVVEKYDETYKWEELSILVSEVKATSPLVYPGFHLTVYINKIENGHRLILENTGAKSLTVSLFPSDQSHPPQISLYSGDRSNPVDISRTDHANTLATIRISDGENELYNHIRVFSQGYVIAEDFGYMVVRSYE